MKLKMVQIAALFYTLSCVSLVATRSVLVGKLAPADDSQEVVYDERANTDMNTEVTTPHLHMGSTPHHHHNHSGTTHHHHHPDSTGSTHHHHPHTTKDPHAGHGGGDDGHSGMKMYFHASENATILWKEWKTDSWHTMFGSCIAWAVIAMLYEGLKVLRILLLSRMSGGGTGSSSSSQFTIAENGFGIEEKQYSTGLNWKRMLTCSHLVQALLHALQVTISLCIMLVFMTYNIWLCLSVVIGAFSGYFFFAWMHSDFSHSFNENCH